MIRRIVGAVVRFLLDQEKCRVRGCPRVAIKDDGCCKRHEVNRLGQIVELSRDGTCASVLPGRGTVAS